MTFGDGALHCTSSNTFKNYFSKNSLRNKEKNHSTRYLNVLVLKKKNAFDDVLSKYIGEF